LENQEEKKEVILIVDDNAFNTDVYQTILEGKFNSCEIVSFNTFDDAECYIQQNVEKITVALLDGKLDQGRFGHELAKLIKFLNAGCWVILLTGTIDLAVSEETRIWFDLLLEKTISSKELVDAIAQNIGNN
jgi:DNA-binding NtrC family response regulator